MTEPFGLIVGSGLDALDLDFVARSPTKTPYGVPSSPILRTVISDRTVLCIARHGENHSIPPHEINYRANVWALHTLGVRRCIAINSVGIIGSSGFEPGGLAIPDQLIDYTWGRADSFNDGGKGTVVHTEFTEPFETVLRGRLAAVAGDRVAAPGRGVYGVVQGPRLETAAEIDRLERDGCTMVGMTAMPEAFLAREAGVAYAVCALGVNHAAGRGPAGRGLHAQVEQYLARGVEKARIVLEALLAEL